MIRVKSCFVIVSPTYKIIGPNLSDFLEILLLLNSKKVYLLSGPLSQIEKSNVIHIRLSNSLLRKSTKNTYAKRMVYIVSQWLVMIYFIRLNRNIDTVICYQSESALTLLLARLLGKKVMVYVGGSLSFCLPGHLERGSMLLLEKLMFMASNKIIGVSESLLSFAYLMIQKHKLTFASTRIFDEKFFARFSPEVKYREREKVVGYIGRLELEKGILEFLEAVNNIFEMKRTIKVLVVGDGSLRDRVQILEKLGVLTSIGWVRNPEAYLNQIKLLVLPSRSEGLPNIILEAMACGTPVLATPVGAIPYLIKDAETGFLLESNEPEYMARRIVGLLDDAELLERVSVNAAKYIRENLSLEKTLQSWRDIY